MKPPGGSIDSLELKMASDKLFEISGDPLRPAAGEFFLEKNTIISVLSEIFSPLCHRIPELKFIDVNLFMLCHTK